MKKFNITGRILFALIFLVSGINHFSPVTIAYAASQGVPMAAIFVPFFGLIAIVGAISIMVGYPGRIGALFIIIFLIPVTIFMHRFWSDSDPTMRQLQLTNFMKNLALLGGAIMLLVRGTEPGAYKGRF
ncbi:MAG: DoxX family protein [Bacteroidota bacterium]|nr:DoxX family protein [Bacteroidota bacterium]